jgi:hypothetical protein
LPVLDPSRPAKWWLDQSFDGQRSRELLDFQPIPLLEGLKSEALWIKDGAPAERSVTYTAPGSAWKK